jgi:serine/threonine protein kinase/Flp pilus assembly protein TadD
MAEQREPLHRLVALKVIKLGMDTKQVIARFEAERQVLALMDHPNIAKVLDAGATDKGRPYFVMELVRGVRITDFCDENSLSTRERLGLLIQVCQAIQHAHQKGIIHRDIKPSNILVTVNDGVAVPKVIDFGIAKATHQQHLTDKTVFTAFEQFLGTPAYMSPEQALMTSVDIDTRSDIYSLGVLLYELLTGRTPFDTQVLLRAGLDELRRTIREEEPVRPSTRVSAMVAAELTRTARHRAVEPPKLIHLLRGDLDWIVMKCLEKDRPRRYETANGLAADVRRHLSQEPVLARQPSRRYWFQKLVQRNKVLFGAMSAVLAALILGLSTSLWSLVHERAARRQAHKEAVRSQQVAQFLKAMLNGVGPSKALGRDTQMLREILDETAQRVGADLKAEPEIEAEVRNTLGEVYLALGELPQAEAMIREALAIRRKVLGSDHADVAASLNDLGTVLYRRGQLPEAETRLREALRMRLKLGDRDPLETAKLLSNLALVLWYQGNLVEAADLCREAVALRRKLQGNTHPDVAGPLSNLALILWNGGKLDEAESACREAIELERRRPGKQTPGLARSLSTLGVILDERGRVADSEAVQREALAMRRKLFARSHTEIAWSLYLLAVVLTERGNWAEAEALHREALSMRRELLGDAHQDLARSLCDLAILLEDRGEFSESEKLHREALEMRRKILGNEHQHVARSLTWLAVTLASQGKLIEAETSLREALAMNRKMLGDKNLSTAHSLACLAEVHRLQGRLAEAETLQRDALATRCRLAGQDRVDVALSLEELARVLQAQGRLAEAEGTNRQALALFRKNLGDHHRSVASTLEHLLVILHDEAKLEEAGRLAREDIAIRQINPDEWQLYWAQSLLGSILLLQTNYTAAEPLLRSGFEGLHQRQERIPFHQASCLAEAMRWLEQLCEATGHHEQAAEWKLKREQAEAQRPGAGD